MTTDLTGGFAVVWNRNPHIGIVEDVQIWAGAPATGTLLFDTSACAEPDDTLDFLLRIASDYYKHDPNDDDALPPDHAILAAYWDHLA
jgi:hypothetical protein